MTEAHEAEAAREDSLRQRREVARLEELDEGRRDFVSAVAHDLQTPVTAIAGFAEILRDEDVDEDERRDLIRRIEANARALEDLIDHLRTFSSLETGRVRLSGLQFAVADGGHEVTGSRHHRGPCAAMQ